ncbi:MAG: methionine ABC transporter permease [Anaerobiospirillum succiniciproducens]|uniref:methionine ABC transporter permease n=1 Tax=Anaerobiospirillum succiniciproducens TaxID=13335 RepID=UPI002A74B496|nr:methionine ABC transporter permease [Anaerobiospirillum succiniciproducens]MDY2798938.1 methionine ABC transporter permease [Anaerobiospirillum succiniciproducens]
MADLLTNATLETLYMVGASSAISIIFGVPLGVLLLITSKGYFFENLVFYRILGTIVNALRSIPFIILMVAITPITKFIVGTSIGTTAVIVPLVVGTIPFTGRLVETSLRTVSTGLIEAATSMGATPRQIVTRVLLPEALPELIQNFTITVIVIIGCSAMAGAIGGGGLGDVAIRYGYMRFRLDMMISTVLILIVMVQLVQFIGDYLTRKVDHR